MGADTRWVSKTRKEIPLPSWIFGNAVLSLQSYHRSVCWKLNTVRCKEYWWEFNQATQFTHCIPLSPLPARGRRSLLQTVSSFSNIYQLKYCPGIVGVSLLGVCIPKLWFWLGSLRLGLCNGTAQSPMKWHTTRRCSLTWHCQHCDYNRGMLFQTSWSRKCCNPSVFALRLTHLGMLVTVKFMWIWGFNLSLTASDL
jgi:hypothetical protein